MHSLYTYIKKVSFALNHPSFKDNRLVRTLVVSDTLYVPEGYRIPSNRALGWIDIDTQNAQENEELHTLLRQEVIKSKIDGLPADAVTEVYRTVDESEIVILNAHNDKVRSNWAQRFAIKVAMPMAPNTEFWFQMNSNEPLRTMHPSQWTGIGDPSFYSSCVFVSDVVAAGKAKEILTRWKEMGFAEKPISTNVREVCYGRQQIQLCTEFQRDALHGSVCGFTPYRSAEMV
jgi:hypothetical protein